MIKALYLIFKPADAWVGILQSQRRAGFLLAFYFLPMVLIASAAEGFGLMEWGRHQANIHRIHKFTFHEMMVYEMARFALAWLIIVVFAVLIKMFGDTFRERNSYRQAFTLAIYGISPIFLLRLLEAVPGLNSWVPWGIGIALSMEVIYRGIPGVLEPDPPNAIGLFFMISLVLVAITGLEQFMTNWYLTGHIRALETVTSSLAAQLPL